MKLPTLFTVCALSIMACSSGSTISREECIANSKYTCIVIPFSGDTYGVSDAIANDLIENCFTVLPQMKLYALLSAEQKDLADLNDFDLANMGKKLNADFLVVGHAFTSDQPYTYTAPSDTKKKSKGYQFSFGEELKKSLAQRQAGTWVCTTYYTLDVHTGEKKLVAQNQPLWKL